MGRPVLDWKWNVLVVGLPMPSYLCGGTISMTAAKVTHAGFFLKYEY
jgi:hypothetical protein